LSAPRRVCHPRHRRHRPVVDRIFAQHLAQHPLRLRRAVCPHELHRQPDLLLHICRRHVRDSTTFAQSHVGADFFFPPPVLRGRVRGVSSSYYHSRSTLSGPPRHPAHCRHPNRSHRNNRRNN